MHGRESVKCSRDGQEAGTEAANREGGHDGEEGGTPMGLRHSDGAGCR